MEKAAGTLYLVGTPIGNLEDISPRALRVLKEVDILLCEDTRRTLNLLRHFGIKQAVQSFHDHSSPRLLKVIRSFFDEGKKIAFVTDGGMPVVSDPGFVLVRMAYNCGATVTTVPGPSAVDVLFAISGLPSPKFLFHGFFPRTKKEIEKILEQIKSLNVVHLFFESPKRLEASLEVIQRNLPDHEMALGRELTKVHEEIFRGTTKEVFDAIHVRDKIRGECTIAVMGGNKPKLTSMNNLTEEIGTVLEKTLTQDQQAEITVYLKAGHSSKDTARELSKKFSVPRRTIYEFIIRHMT